MPAHLVMGIDDDNRAPINRGLLIAISYAHPEREPVRSLGTPPRDVERFRRRLINKHGYLEENVVVLVDDPAKQTCLQPTKTNILREIESLTNGAKAGDRFVFYYAGHCYQLVNRNNSEDDGYDEDHNGEPTDDQDMPLDPENLPSDDPKWQKRIDGVITDNELRELLVDKLPPGTFLTAILDTCHSATLLDLNHYLCNSVWFPWTAKAHRCSRSLIHPAVRHDALDTERRKSSGRKTRLSNMWVSDKPAHDLSIVTEETSSQIMVNIDLNVDPGSASSTSTTMSSRTRTRKPTVFPVTPKKTLTRRACPPRVVRSTTVKPSAMVSSPKAKSPRLMSPRVNHPKRTIILPPVHMVGLEPITITPISHHSSTEKYEQLTSKPTLTLKTSRKGSFDMSSLGIGMLRCMSPQRVETYQDCDGWCTVSESDTQQGPHVISLSSASDTELTWDGARGESMTWMLLDILDETHVISLKELVQQLGYRMYKYLLGMHQWTEKYKKRKKAKRKKGIPRGNSQEYDDLTLNFQAPQLGSLSKLDLDTHFKL